MAYTIKVFAMWAKAQYNLYEGFRLFNLEERKGTQNTFLYGVTPSVFKGLQRRATVYFPIWWGIAAWPVNEFIETNDFTGKTVIPFCTSASSGLGESGKLLEEMAKTGDWQEGQRFRSSASEEDVREWIKKLGL